GSKHGESLEFGRGGDGILFFISTVCDSAGNWPHLSAVSWWGASRLEHLHDVFSDAAPWRLSLFACSKPEGHAALPGAGAYGRLGADSGGVADRVAPESHRCQLDHRPTGLLATVCFARDGRSVL